MSTSVATLPVFIAGQLVEAGDPFALPAGIAGPILALIVEHDRVTVPNFNQVVLPVVQELPISEEVAAAAPVVGVC